MKRPIVMPLAGAVLTMATLAGCGSLHRDASPATTGKATSATSQAEDQTSALCSGQAGWNKLYKSSVQALYADTGALSADAHAGNMPGVAKAGRKLASDAIAAAALPLPIVDSSSWKALTADYATAGAAIGGGDATGAVPQLEAGNGAISSFTSAVGKCPGTKL